MKWCASSAAGCTGFCLLGVTTFGGEFIERSALPSVLTASASICALYVDDSGRILGGNTKEGNIWRDDVPSHALWSALQGMGMGAGHTYQ